MKFQIINVAGTTYFGIMKSNSIINAMKLSNVDKPAIKDYYIETEKGNLKTIDFSEHCQVVVSELSSELEVFSAQCEATMQIAKQKAIGYLNCQIFEQLLGK